MIIKAKVASLGDYLFQNILGMLCLKIEKNQIWPKKMLQYTIT
jgi:hypothetical protein